MHVGPETNHRRVSASCVGRLVVFAARNVSGAMKGARELGDVQRVEIRCGMRAARWGLIAVVVFGDVAETANLTTRHLC
jgi:hypothetical protein